MHLRGHGCDPGAQRPGEDRGRGCGGGAGQRGEEQLFSPACPHDMRTPMNGIVGMAAIAKRCLGDPDRVLDCLNKIDFSSRHLLSLINDVLDMSKIESGKLALVSEPPLTSGELLPGA